MSNETQSWATAKPVTDYIVRATLTDGTDYQLRATKDEDGVLRLQGKLSREALGLPLVEETETPRYSVTVNDQVYALKSARRVEVAGLSSGSAGQTTYWYDYATTVRENPEVVLANPLVRARVVLDEKLPGHFNLVSFTGTHLWLADLHEYTKIGHPIEWTPVEA